MSPARTCHAAGMAMVLAFALAAILSARAAKPVPVKSAPVEFTALVTSLMLDTGVKGLQWRDLDTRLPARWLKSTGAGPAPEGFPNTSVQRTGSVPVLLAGRPLPFAHEWSGRKVDGWSVSFWGDERGPVLMQLRGADQCKKPCTPAGVEADQALHASSVSFRLECETPRARYLRLLARGKQDAYLLQYRAAAGVETSMFVFWTEPPAAMLNRAGCGMGPMAAKPL